VVYGTGIQERHSWAIVAQSFLSERGDAETARSYSGVCSFLCSSGHLLLIAQQSQGNQTVYMIAQGSEGSILRESARSGITFYDEFRSHNVTSS
jgi:hypothetical protein